MALKKPMCEGKKIKIMVKLLNTLLRSDTSIGYICCYGIVLMCHNGSACKRSFRWFDANLFAIKGKPKIRFKITITRLLDLVRFA